MEMYKLSEYLKNKFGERIHKINIDAGFACPNKDGAIGNDGCIYCDNKAFSFYNRQKKTISLQEQIKQNMVFARRRFKAEKFFLFFQSNTNTHDSIENLKKRYEVIREFKDFVGIAIATRPDCINEEKLDLIESYKKDYDVWIEYGLQSSHNKTLEFINRGHTYEDFINAFNRTRKRNIKICVHVIVGLPKEDLGMMLETAERLKKLKPDGVKIHPIHVVKGTKLEEYYNNTQYEVLSLNDYISIVKKYIKILGKEIIIHRIGAYCPPEFLVAPSWIGKRLNYDKLLRESICEKV